MSHGLRLCAALAAFLVLVSFNAWGEGRLIVVDEDGAIVPGVTLMLGYEPGQPIPDNVIRTELDGGVNLPETWKVALPLTLSAPGFVTITIPVINYDARILILPRVEPPPTIQIKGTTTGYGRLASDGKVDFGLVIPALTRETMFTFDLATLISPDADVIKIIGNEVKIPSNISLPEQKETLVLPITLNKPDYRMFVRKPGAYRVGVSHGQFPLQKVVSDLRAGKSFLDVVNAFEFKELGQKTVNITKDVQGVDLAVNQTQLKDSFNVQAPTLPAGLTMLGVGLYEQDGTFVPTDVKRFTSGQKMALRTNSAAGPSSLLAILLADEAHTARSPGVEPSAVTDLNRLSFAAAPAGTIPKFLPLVEKPRLSGQTLKFGLPKLPEGLVAAGLALTLVEIEDIPAGDDVKVQRRTRVWEMFSEAWLTQMELPKITWTRQPGRRYSWDVTFLARAANFIGASDVKARVDFKTITHATRNSTNDI